MVLCTIGQTSLLTGLHLRDEALRLQDLHRCQSPSLRSRSRLQSRQSQRLQRSLGQSQQAVSITNGKLKQKLKQKMRLHGQDSLRGAMLRAKGVLLSCQDNGERTCHMKDAENAPVTDSNHGAGKSGAQIRTTAVSADAELTLLPHGTYHVFFQRQIVSMQASWLYCHVNFLLDNFIVPQTNAIAR